MERFDSADILLRTDATSYDSRGRVTSESTPEGILAYDYDALGRTEVVPFLGATRLLV